MAYLSEAARAELVLKEFNFTKVQRCMALVDWRWNTDLGEYSVPTVEQLKDCAADLLQEAVRRNTSVGTGGFTASMDQFGEVTLSFVLEIQSAEPDVVESKAVVRPKRKAASTNDR